MDVGTQTGKDGKGHKKTPSHNLQDQAATAALYVTNQHKQPKSSVLDANGKLSSASAATSLKYAEPRDLPSYPSVGINTDSSAGAAASLANANHKSFEHWKPDASSNAGKAAMLAKDYKMQELWHPEDSAAGSKAAMLAAKKGGNVEIWRPDATSDGNSAAGFAMSKKNLSPEIDYGYTDDGHKRALMAATGAMNAKPQKWATEPGLIGLSEQDANRIHKAAITNLDRQMYTSNPPVAPEVEEKKRQAALRASAVVMARQMYASQQKALSAHAGAGPSDSQSAATHMHNRSSSVATSEAPYAAPVNQYPGLQEAAQRLASERLAKLRDEHAEYRDYYGAHDTAPKSRMSMMGSRRGRPSKDEDEDVDDRRQAAKVRSQMSALNTHVATIDADKQKKDRDALMAAAQRNVRRNMDTMDESVFQQTGKVSPNMAAEWEAKARARAEADSKDRMVNHGKVNIGGGRYMDQSEIDAIAAARVQPTLDEVTATAERRRAEDEQRRQEEEARRIAEMERARDEQARNDRSKEEWRKYKENEKEEKRRVKEEERIRKHEERHAAMLARETEKKRWAAQKQTVEDAEREKKMEAVRAREAKAAEEANARMLQAEAEKNEKRAAEADIAVPAPAVDEAARQDETPIPTGDNLHRDATETLASPNDIAARVFQAPVENETIHNVEPHHEPIHQEEASSTNAHLGRTAEHDTSDAPPREEPSEGPKDVEEPTTKPSEVSNVESETHESGANDKLEEQADGEKVTPFTGEKEDMGEHKEPVASRVAIPAAIATAAAQETSGSPRASKHDPAKSPASPKTDDEKEKSGVSSWLKNRFSRNRGKSVSKQDEEKEKDHKLKKDQPKEKDVKKSHEGATTAAGVAAIAGPAAVAGHERSDEKPLETQAPSDKGQSIETSQLDAEKETTSGGNGIDVPITTGDFGSDGIPHMKENIQTTHAGAVELASNPAAMKSDPSIYSDDSREALPESGTQESNGRGLNAVPFIAGGDQETASSTARNPDATITDPASDIPDTSAAGLVAEQENSRVTRSRSTSISSLSSDVPTKTGQPQTVGASAPLDIEPSQQPTSTLHDPANMGYTGDGPHDDTVADTRTGAPGSTTTTANEAVQHDHSPGLIHSPNVKDTIDTNPVASLHDPAGMGYTGTGPHDQSVDPSTRTGVDRGRSNIPVWERGMELLGIHKPAHAPETAETSASNDHTKKDEGATSGGALSSVLGDGNRKESVTEADDEEFEEARDHFDADNGGKLVSPAEAGHRFGEMEGSSHGIGKATQSPARETRFKEEL